jgi:hypothetical protein
MVHTQEIRHIKGVVASQMAVEGKRCVVYSCYIECLIVLINMPSRALWDFKVRSTGLSIDRVHRQTLPANCSGSDLLHPRELYIAILFRAAVLRGSLIFDSFR